MNQEKFKAILPYICSDLIALICVKRAITEQEALKLLYASRLYAMLEQEDTKMWQYSSAMLYSMLEQEETTGQIIFPEV